MWVITFIIHSLHPYFSHSFHTHCEEATRLTIISHNTSPAPFLVCPFLSSFYSLRRCTIVSKTEMILSLPQVREYKTDSHWCAGASLYHLNDFFSSLCSVKPSWWLENGNSWKYLQYGNQQMLQVIPPTPSPFPKELVIEHLPAYHWIQKQINIMA